MPNKQLDLQEVQQLGYSDGFNGYGFSPRQEGVSKILRDEYIRSFYEGEDDFDLDLGRKYAWAEESA